MATNNAKININKKVCSPKFLRLLPDKVSSNFIDEKVVCVLVCVHVFLLSMLYLIPKHNS